MKVLIGIKSSLNVETIVSEKRKYTHKSNVILFMKPIILMVLVYKNIEWHILHEIIGVEYS